MRSRHYDRGQTTLAMSENSAQRPLSTRQCTANIACARELLAAPVPPQKLKPAHGRSSAPSAPAARLQAALTVRPIAISPARAGPRASARSPVPPSPRSPNRSPRVRPWTHGQRPSRRRRDLSRPPSVSLHLPPDFGGRPESTQAGYRRARVACSEADARTGINPSTYEFLALRFGYTSGAPVSYSPVAAKSVQKPCSERLTTVGQRLRLQPR